MTLDDLPGLSEQIRAQLAAITDTKARAELAGGSATVLRELWRSVAAIRDEAAVDLLATGMRPYEVAQLTGISQTQMTRFKDRV